jgi:hypothetical protein
MNQAIFIPKFTVYTVNIELNEVHHGVEISGQADTRTQCSVFLQFLRRVERPLIELLLYYLMASSFKSRQFIVLSTRTFVCFHLCKMTDEV